MATPGRCNGKTQTESRESARGRYRTSPAAARPAAPGGARGGGHSRSRLSRVAVSGHGRGREAGEPSAVRERGRGAESLKDGAGFLSVNCFYVYISMPLHASRRGCGVDRCLASGSRVPVCGVRSGLEVAALRPALPVRAARRGSRGGRCRKALDSREPSGVAACSHRRRGRVSGRAAEEARLSQGMLLFMRLGERSR